MKRREFMKISAVTAAMASAGVSTSYAQKPVKVGVLIPGSIADKGYMESAYLGFKEVEKKLKDKVSFQLIENINYADMEQVFVQLASKNQFVVAVSGASQSAMTKVARRFPNVKFSLCGGASLSADAPKNMAQFDARQAEVAFLAGAAAALFSKSGSVAYIGGREIPSIINSGKEFENGAKYVSPNIKVIQTLTGDFDDVAKAKEATLAAAGQGADVAFHILNRGLQGFEQAARERQMKLIGGILPRCDADPIYAAFTKTNVGYILEQAVVDFLGNNWKAGSSSFGLKAGSEASDIILCGSTDKKISAKLEEIKKDLASGKIVTLEG